MQGEGLGEGVWNMPRARNFVAHGSASQTGEHANIAGCSQPPPHHGMSELRELKPDIQGGSQDLTPQQSIPYSMTSIPRT